MKNLSNDKLALYLDELAAFEPNGFPFTSLYLNAQADRHGRDNFAPFIRKELASRAKTFAEGSREREYFERDAGRIIRYLIDDLEHSANGAAIFASTGADGFFKTIELDAPFHTNSLYVSDHPHICPLARLIERNPVYVVLLADTKAARIFVFDLGCVRRREEFSADVKNFASVGKHSQIRYRRRVENNLIRHAKETVEMLERVVAEDKADGVILAGDEIIIAQLQQKIPAEIADKVIDILQLDIRAPEHEILKAIIESLREDNLQTDAEKVRDLFDQFRADSLATVGLEKTMYALVKGQADELLLSASPDDILTDKESAAVLSPSPPAGAAAAVGAPVGTIAKPANELSRKMIADALVSLARKSGTAITFIEDRRLLADVGGIGAFLRYKI